jgi:hypothetical protein
MNVMPAGGEVGSDIAGELACGGMVGCIKAVEEENAFHRLTSFFGAIAAIVTP